MMGPFSCSLIPGGNACPGRTCRAHMALDSQQRVSNIAGTGQHVLADCNTTPYDSHNSMTWGMCQCKDDMMSDFRHWSYQKTKRDKSVLPYSSSTSQATGPFGTAECKVVQCERHAPCRQCATCGCAGRCAPQAPCHAAEPPLSAGTRACHAQPCTAEPIKSEITVRIHSSTDCPQSWHPEICRAWGRAPHGRWQGPAGRP
jgi:hypothetical protein